MAKAGTRSSLNCKLCAWFPCTRTSVRVAHVETNLTTNLAPPVVGVDKLMSNVYPQPLAVRVEPSQQQPL